ncbi:unnamed protein product, partial [Choristocarpus tenellus]
MASTDDSLTGVDGDGDDVDVTEELSDDSDEVCLMEEDEELANALEEAGIVVKDLDEDGNAFELEVMHSDVLNFLVLSPEEDYLGARVQGFIPWDNGEPSLLEVQGKLLVGDVLTHLNGSNARLLNFSDILMSCRDPERGGLPRPLAMHFSRMTALVPAPAEEVKRETVDSGAGGGGLGAAQGGGGPGFLEELIGGLTLGGFYEPDRGTTFQAEQGQPATTSLSLRGRVDGLKDIVRSELVAQGVLPTPAEGHSTDDTNKERASPGGGGDNLLASILRRLETVDLLDGLDAEDKRNIGGGGLGARSAAG